MKKKAQKKVEQTKGFADRLKSIKVWQIILGVVVVLTARYFYFSQELHSQQQNSNEFSQDDYFVENMHGEANYMLKDKLKKLAHPDVGKHRKRVSQPVDQFWQGKEKIAEKIASLYNQFNYKQMDLLIHFENNQNYNKPSLGIISDPEYCEKSNMHHILHPESILDNYLIFTDFGYNELPREVAQQFGYDVLPQVSQQMSDRKQQERVYNLPVETALIHSRISRIHHFFEFNKNIICTYQSANHIPGKWSITGKDLVIDNYRLYQQKPFVDKDKCWQHVTFMPESYRLYNSNECKSFFRYLQSNEYRELIKKDGIGFIMKQGRDIHRGQGINLISPKILQDLLKKYNNGNKCDSVKEVYQVQRYINNPILHDNKKLEVRIYFFIASTDPLIIYVQKLALLKKCANDYDKFDYDFSKHVCNTSISKQITDSFVVEFALEGLEKYLLENNKITNPNWLEEEIYPQIYRAVTHLVRSGAHDFLIDSRVNENFALDFLIDEDSKVWFLENNPNPQVLRSSVKRTMRHYVMFGDLFQIQFAYLRSRAKRLNQLAKQMAEEIQNNTFDQQTYKIKFQNANKNFLDPEFESQIRKDSSYVKIYDESLEGEQKFMGYLPKECLYKNQI
ncbi:hypothetical protein ABPG74_012750 [Tetrahymena malaccensis]